MLLIQIYGLQYLKRKLARLLPVLLAMAARSRNDALRDGRLVGILEQGLYSCGYKSLYVVMDQLLNGKLTQFEKVEYNNYTIVTKEDLPQWDFVAEIVAGFVAKYIA